MVERRREEDGVEIVARQGEGGEEVEVEDVTSRRMLARHGRRVEMLVRRRCNSDGAVMVCAIEFRR
jgi:hypothetical protein